VGKMCTLTPKTLSPSSYCCVLCLQVSHCWHSGVTPEHGSCASQRSCNARTVARTATLRCAVVPQSRGVARQRSEYCSTHRRKGSPELTARYVGSPAARCTCCLSRVAPPADVACAVMCCALQDDAPERRSDDLRTLPRVPAQRSQLSLGPAAG